MSKPRSPLLAQSQSLSDWLSYLEQIHPQTIDLGLARVGEVAERLGVRQLPMPVVLVGGTVVAAHAVAHGFDGWRRTCDGRQTKLNRI